MITVATWVNRNTSHKSSLQEASLSTPGHRSVLTEQPQLWACLCLLGGRWRPTGEDVTHTGDLQEVPELLLPLLLQSDHGLLVLVHKAHHLLDFGQQLQCLLLTNHGLTVRNERTTLPRALRGTAWLPAMTGSLPCRPIRAEQGIQLPLGFA